MQALTRPEQDVIRQLAKVWNELCSIVGDGPTRDADLAELVVHVHALQQAVMSQAAGRIYPTELRLLGETRRTP